MMIRVATLILLVYPLGVPAPVPRCSPFIIINKLAEFSSIWSDSNPYFPVPPCEYGNPLNALASQDYQSVFVTAQPLKIPLHNFYEFVWLLKTGLPRMFRVALGQEKLEVDNNILQEGYKHYTPYVRTGELGHGTQRRPEIIDDFGIYQRTVGNKINELISEGPDTRPTAYTPQGPLHRSSAAGTKINRAPQRPAAVRPYRKVAAGNHPRQTAAVQRSRQAAPVGVHGSHQARFRGSVRSPSSYGTRPAWRPVTGKY